MQSLFDAATRLPSHLCAVILCGGIRSGSIGVLAHRSFRSLDRDTDGRLTLAEVKGDLNMEPRFDDADANRDGVITLKELDDYLVLRYGVARRL